MANLLFYVPSSTPAAIGGIDSYTKLMMHLDGDQSDSQHTVSHDGNPQFSTIQSKFGGSSMYFDGSGDYLSVADHADFTLGADDFTWEMWIRVEAWGANPSWQTIIAEHNPYSPVFLQIRHTTINELFLYMSSNGTSWNVANTELLGLLSAGTWYHLAIARDGNNVRCFIDGVLVNTVVTSASLYNGATPIIFGGNSYGSNYYFNGYLEEIRLSDTARYTADFSSSLPSAPYTSDANTSLLLHMNGDVSDSAHVVTSNGNPALNAATAKFDGAMYFDGNDCLSVPNSTDWAFLTGDFTVDGWFRFDSLPSDGNHSTLLSKYNSTGDERGFICRLTNDSGTYKLRFTYSTDGTVGTAVNLLGDGISVSINTWYHIAFVRDSTAIRMFLDGTGAGSPSIGTDNINDSAEALCIGQTNSGLFTNTFNGYMDEVRISKGIARWTTDFTLNTGPYTE